MANWNTKELEWTIKDVGAPLLDSITSGVYSGLAIFREYVQNAVDSYAGFERTTGLLPQNDVQVSVDTINGNLSIMDYGLGMDWEDIKIARKIAVSPKLRSTEYVGFRGIGIWSGLSVCKKLVITTTKYGDSFEYRLTIDCSSIVEQIGTPIPLDELLQDRVGIQEREGELGSHYTRVALYGVNQTVAGELLNPQALRKYAEQNLPVPFSPEWKDEKGFSYTDAVTRFLEDVPWTTTYNLTIDNDPVYRRFPNPKVIQAPEFVEIFTETKPPRKIGVAWVSETRRAEGSKRGVIDISDGGVRNIAIRVKNFVVGDRGRYSEEQVKDANNLEWYVGEVYIVDPEIRPDTNRSGFHPDAGFNDVVQALRKFYTSTASGARALSNQLSVLQKCTQAKNIIEEIRRLFSQQAIDDATNMTIKTTVERYFNELSQVKAPIQEAMNDIVAKDLPGEAESSLKNKSYLRKRDVRSVIEQTLGQIKVFEDEWPSLYASRFNVNADSAPAISSKPQRKSTARTKTLQGKPVTSGITVPSAGNPIPVGTASVAKANQQGQSVDIDTAIEAFKASVAAVLGENTDSYKRIIERLPIELERRGINV